MLKLILAPLLVALATLVARRWGPKIGGIVVGLPLTTGPIFLFLALDQGLDFGARACVGILFGLVGLAGFALVYAAVSRRAGGVVSLMASAAAYFVVSGAVNSLALNRMIGAALAAYAALLLVAWLIKRPQPGATKPVSRWWDIWFRMITAAGLTLAITTAAERLGPTFSGIVGTYPVVTTVIMTFTHHQSGREVAIAMLRGTVLSWIGFVSAFLVIGLTLIPYGLTVALVLAVLANLGTTILALWIDRFITSRTKGNPHEFVPARPFDR
ncbi:hypothetical protein QO002_002421 [Pararhizobium capsulatum DSM 1112]|uniref:Uncharacterized protein n=1 Tax=Pararhizobium capsulatum DSM 1112 TaxID=1121113 RepID=A0ABU0BPW6_9HYPH|nr:hypothetical protein [Pararhizobium capsulatum]MDQ0320283.1 hypothetical protein [Pararhizobium capsulatum DSM 1112]